MGKAWKCGDSISTDLIAPGMYFHLRSNLPELAKHVLEGARPEFASLVKSGDFVVAGENFGLGAFVTLQVDGELRGCIGTFTPRGSLAQTVADMAKAAATEDPRFTKLRADELAALSISVSALRTPHLLEDRSRIEVGLHGLVVRKGWNRGVLLPKVAVEHGWDGPTFLKQACLKAGLPAIAARDPDLVVEVFVAEEFGEE